MAGVTKRLRDGAGEVPATLVLVYPALDVTVEFEPGTAHGHVNEPFTPGGQTSLERIGAWLGERGTSG